MWVRNCPRNNLYSVIYWSQAACVLNSFGLLVSKSTLCSDQLWFTGLNKHLVFWWVVIYWSYHAPCILICCDLLVSTSTFYSDQLWFTGLHKHLVLWFIGLNKHLACFWFVVIYWSRQAPCIQISCDLLVSISTFLVFWPDMIYWSEQAPSLYSGELWFTGQSNWRLQLSFFVMGMVWHDEILINSLGKPVWPKPFDWPLTASTLVFERAYLFCIGIAI